MDISDYAELEADHRTTLAQLEAVRKAYSDCDDELDKVRRELVAARGANNGLYVAVSTLAVLNGNYADALVYVADLLDNMMGSDDMAEVQAWKERFESEIALARRVKAAVKT